MTPSLVSGSVGSPVRLSNHDLSLGIVKHGYLWKRSSNVKRDWKRRWFLIQGGKLKYQRQEVRNGGGWGGGYFLQRTEIRLREAMRTRGLAPYSRR